MGYEPPNYVDNIKGWDTIQGLGKEYLGSLEKQATVKHDAESKYVGQQTADIAALRLKAARAQAGGRGLLGGGAGLAQARQGAIERGMAESQVGADYATKIQAAAEEAAGADTQVIEEKQKMAAQAAMRQSKISAAVQRAREITAEDTKNIYFYTQDDKAKTAKRIRSEVLAMEQDPEVLQAVESYLQQLQSANQDTAGTWDW